MKRISRESFIRLGAALGVGAAAASVAACGGGSGGGSAGGSGGGSAGGSGGANESPAASGVGPTTPAAEGTTVSGGGSGGGSGSGGGVRVIAQESEVTPGSAVEFEDGGKDAILVHVDGGRFVAYSAVCTHAGCTVAYRNSQLACPCHGSIFDPANGAAVVSGPAQRPLPEIPVQVRNGEVVKA